MDKQTELQQCLEMADNDLAIAYFSVKYMYPVPYAIICFHSVQSRYPNEMYVENHDMEKAIEYVKTIREFILEAEKNEENVI